MGSFIVTRLTIHANRLAVAPGKAVAEISAGKYPFILIYALWLFFSPAVWLLTQLELNKLAEE